MFLFRVKRTVKLGIKSLWMHRMRSILTTLGIIFGVSSVIAMLAIGEGASKHAQEQIAKMGSQNIIIKSVKPPEEQEATGQQQSLLEYGLTYSDAERFRNSIPEVEVVVPNRILSKKVWYRNRKIDTTVIGTVPWYPELAPIELKMGRFISSVDTHYTQGICIVDEMVVNKLFAFDYPLGQDIKIGSDYYRVVGVVSPYESKSNGNNLNNGASSGQTQSQEGSNVGRIYIPLTTVRNRFGEISIQISGSSGPNAERVELQEIIVKAANIGKVLPTRNIIDTLLDRFHKKADYQITVPIALLKQAKESARIFSIVLGSIAAISLLVGGIGIMNIMLATVSERTREIGIRRALGAKKRDIMLQFLSETLLLTLIGGISGIILGVLMPLLVTHFANMPTVITVYSLVLAFGISATIGVMFGMYPAYRAANMDPIESLRHE